MCTRIGTIVQQKDGHATVYKLSCKSWSCPDCSKKRRARLVAEARAGKPSRFITLTVNPHWYDSPEQRAEKLVWAWREFVRDWRKRHKRWTGEYLAVFEATKHGEPHLHIMWRGNWVGQRELSKWMERKIGAPIVDIRAVTGKKAVAQYVTKYISKRNIKFGNLKRYWRSMHYLAESNAARKRRMNAGSIWYVLDYDFNMYLSIVEKRGIEIDIDSAGHGQFDLLPWDTAPPGCLLTEPLISR